MAELAIGFETNWEMLVQQQAKARPNIFFISHICCFKVDFFTNDENEPNSK